MNIEAKVASNGSDADAKSTPLLELVATLTARLGKAVDMPLRPQDSTLLEDMESFRFGPSYSRLAWSTGDGPLVILVHGYSGRGVQMAPLAIKLAEEGFRCVFFDAGGHGASDAEKVGFATFMNDTRDIIAHLGEPVQALIGHSAGGLALMRARSIFGFAAQKYGIISAPIYPYVPLVNMRGRGAPEDALSYVKAVLCDQFQLGWSSLVKGDSFAPEEDKELLAIYDTEDPMVRHTDADEIAALWPDATVIKTHGYGHNRILKANETLDAFVNLIKE